MRYESVPIGDAAPSLGSAMRQKGSKKQNPVTDDLSAAMNQKRGKKHAGQGNRSLQSIMKQG